jgi:putative ATP-dependent endonuclease of the OLD family
MKIDSVEIQNFRNLTVFSLDFGGETTFVVGENATSKTSLLSAIARALGKERTTTFADFADPAKPIEAILKLSGFDRADHSVFPKEMSFAGTPTLRIGYRAEWNAKEEECDGLCGFPDHGWKAASREQRDALPVVWLPGYREPDRLLQLGGPRGFWSRLFASISIDPAIAAAVAEVQGALTRFAAAPDLAALLANLTTSLGRFIPDVAPGAFSLGFRGTQNRDLLREFELFLSHGGSSLPIQKQSDGLIHLAVFAMVLQVLASEPRSILLVDEPEVSLHPQAQRALISAMRRLPNQAVIATHSSNVLDRADLRRVVRLQRGGTSIVPARATTLSQVEADRLARFVNPLTAEACFARKVIFVEGYSDRVVMIHLASRLGIDLDARGVTVLSLDGGGAIGTFLKLFGAAGLRLDVFGMCDEDKEPQWLDALRHAGVAVTDRASMRAAGFHVCVRDLEQEFIRALSPAGTQAMIAKEGQAAQFATFQQQSAHALEALDEQLRRFLHNNNTQWAIPLVEALDLHVVPGPLNDLITTF